MSLERLLAIEPQREKLFTAAMRHEDGPVRLCLSVPA